MAGLSLFLAWTVSCDGEHTVLGTPTEPFTSGQRLRAIVYDGGDGARLFRGWHDSTTGKPCAILHDREGTLRCLPILEEGEARYTDFDIFYLDQDCTQPVRVVRGTGAWPSMATVPPAVAQGCGRHMVYRTGDELPSGTPLFASFGGSCTSYLATSSYDVGLALEEEMPPSAFVRGQLRNESRGGRLAARHFVGDDGSSQIVGIVDEARGTLCEGLFGQVGPCIPAPVAREWGDYADPTCTVPVAYSTPSTPSNSGCGPAKAVVSFEGDTCDVPYEVFAAGREVSPAYAQTVDGCDEVSPTMDIEYYERGEAIALESLAVLHDEPVGNGRLGALYAAGDTEGPFTPGYAPRFFDRTLGVVCEPGGCAGIRCLPSTDSVSLVYLDEACTQPAALRWVGLSICGEIPPVPPVGWMHPGPSTCPVGELRHLGSRFDQKPNVVFAADGCHPIYPSDQEEVIELGVAVPPDELVEIAQYVE